MELIFDKPDNLMMGKDLCVINVNGKDLYCIIDKFLVIGKFIYFIFLRKKILS